MSKLIAILPVSNRLKEEHVGRADRLKEHRLKEEQVLFCRFCIFHLCIYFCIVRYQKMFENARLFDYNSIIVSQYMS
jgi:hypothetical protein